MIGTGMPGIGSNFMVNLREIEEHLGGVLVGDNISINSLTTPDFPLKNSIAVITSRRLLKQVAISDIAAFVIPEGFGSDFDKPVILVYNIQQAMQQLIDIFYPVCDTENYRAETAIIGSNVTIHTPSYIGEFVTIGDNSEICAGTYIDNKVSIGDNVSIGEGCKIYAGVYIYHNSIIGNNVTLNHGSIIGSDGFGYINGEKGHTKIRQVGNVIIEDDVELGANSCIDRATLNSTVIGQGTKIDNLVQIGHNVHIGKHCIIVSQTGISGSSKVGNFVMLGGQVGISDHINIPDRTIIAAKSGVTGNIKKSGVYAGFPIVEHVTWLKNMLSLRHLYKLKKEVDALKRSGMCK